MVLFVLAPALLRCTRLILPFLKRDMRLAGIELAFDVVFSLALEVSLT